MFRRKIFLAAISVLSAGAAASCAAASTHVTNGAFDTNEWTSGPGSAASLNPSTEPRAPFAFNPATTRGGAVLYVEQSTAGAGALNAFGTTLNLMYDYVSSPAALGGASNASNSSVDIFFEVPNDADYIVHITSSGFLAFEKPNGTPSPENADGTLHFMDNSNNPVGPWTTLTANDLALANFHTALGFGTSPNSATSHLIAEFDLTIDSKGSGGAAGGGNDGIYDPAPAFWSADGKNGNTDPVFSSEIFNLQSDGTTLASKVVNGNGDPVAQPSDVPEPATMTLLTTAVGAALLRRRSRR